MCDFPEHYSFTNFLYKHAAPYITTDYKDNCLKQTAKIGAGFIMNPVFAAIFVIEAVVRAIFALIIYPISCFLPLNAEDPLKLKNNFSKYLISTSIINIMMSAHAFTQPIANFNPPEITVINPCSNCH